MKDQGRGELHKQRKQQVQRPRGMSGVGRGCIVEGLAGHGEDLGFVLV